MSCPQCAARMAARSARPARPCGLYRAGCVECCARLVLASRPSRALAAGMLAAVARFPQAPGRSEILARVARIQGEVA